MAYIPVPDVAQLELIMSWDTQRIENVLHYTKAGGYQLDDLGILAEALITAWGLGPRGSMSSAVTLLEVRATDLSAQNGPAVTITTGLPLAGLITSTPSLPNNVAIVMTKRTPLRGRSFRGRLYHPGLVEGEVVNNQVVSGRVTGLLNSYNSLIEITDIESDVNQMVVVSRYANNAPRVTGVATPVFNFTTDGMIDSMRRRLPGRGA